MNTCSSSYDITFRVVRNYLFLVPVVHKAITRVFQCCLSWDQSWICSRVNSSSVTSFSLGRLHISLRLPLFLFPDGVHHITTLGTGSGCILRTWSIYFHLFLSNLYDECLFSCTTLYC